MQVYNISIVTLIVLSFIVVIISTSVIDKDTSKYGYPINISINDLSTELYDSEYDEVELDSIIYRCIFSVAICSDYGHFVFMNDIQLVEDFGVITDNLYTTYTIEKTIISTTDTFTIVTLPKGVLLKNITCSSNHCLTLRITTYLQVFLNETLLAINNCLFSDISFYTKVTVTAGYSNPFINIYTNISDVLFGKLDNTNLPLQYIQAKDTKYIRIPSPIYNTITWNTSNHLLNDSNYLCDSSIYTQKMVKLIWTFKNDLPISKQVKVTLYGNSFNWYKQNYVNCFPDKSNKFMCLLNSKSKASITLYKCINLYNNRAYIHNLHYSLVVQSACRPRLYKSYQAIIVSGSR